MSYHKLTACAEDAGGIATMVKDSTAETHTARTTHTIQNIQTAVMSGREGVSDDRRYICTERVDMS